MLISSKKRLFINFKWSILKFNLLQQFNLKSSSSINVVYLTINNRAIEF